jgi:hypothetical protein
MSSLTLYRGSAVAGLLSGLALIIGQLMVLVVQQVALWQFAQILITLSPFLLLYLLPALYLFQRRESGALGGLGFLVISLGILLVSVNYYTQTVAVHILAESARSDVWGTYLGKAWLVGEVVSLLGVVLFCIATLQANRFPRPAPILYGVGMAFFTLLHLVVPDAATILFTVVGVVAGAGIIWFACSLWSGAE